MRTLARWSVEVYSLHVCVRTLEAEWLTENRFMVTRKLNAKLRGKWIFEHGARTTGHLLRPRRWDGAGGPRGSEKKRTLVAAAK